MYREIAHMLEENAQRQLQVIAAKPLGKLIISGIPSVDTFHQLVIDESWAVVLVKNVSNHYHYL